MKNKRIRIYVLLVLALLVFWGACFGVLFWQSAETAEEVARRRAVTARDSFDEAVVALANDMRYQYTQQGGRQAQTLDEMYPVIARMTAQQPDEFFCVMDPSGYLYADNDRLINWLGADVRGTVDETGYAVVYIHEIFGIERAIALVTPVDGSNYYSLVRVVSTESFATSLAGRISEPYEYIAVFNTWGDLMVLQTGEKENQVSASVVRQASAAYEGSGQTEIVRLNGRYDYDVFIPLRQPQGWMLTIRMMGTDLMPTYNMLLALMIAAAVFSAALVATYIIVDALRIRRNPSGNTGDIDGLTGLYTLGGLELALQNFFRRAVMRDYCLVYMDIASFRRFNVMFGHKMGDVLLQTVGGYIRKHFYCGARPNSDIFVFVIKATDNIKEDVEQPIRDNIQASLGLQYLQMISFNFGVYPLLQDRFNFRDVSDGAMMALRHAKSHAKGNEVIYDMAMLKEDRMNKHIEVNMLHALSSDEFKMYVQPKFHADNVSCCGGEALVRWQSEQMGLLLPYQFISLFERNGFIVEVDFYMLENIFKFQRDAIRQGHKLLPISVNQSRVTISMPNYLERIRDLVGRYDVPLDYINIEITESILTESYDIVVPLVQQLKEIGFAIDMDDFGKGYSSLNTLRELPVDVLKIDKEFLRESDTSQRGRRIIESVISMARALDINTVCEGVETGMQLDFLRESGCDMVQGYYLSRPIIAQEYRQLYLQEHPAAGAAGAAAHE